MILDTPVDPAKIYLRLMTAPTALAAADLPAGVETVLLSGSFAHGRADRLSDVDIHVLSASDERSQSGDDPLWAVQEVLRRHLGTDEVYANWVNIDGPADLLARNLAGAQVLFSLNEERFRLLKGRIFPDGHMPAVRDVVRATSLSRANLAVSERHPLPSALARRCLSLGHEAIRTFCLPVPEGIEGIPGALLAAGIVRRREAEWVLWRHYQFHYHWNDGYRRSQNGFNCGVDLGRDFAWHTLNALERAYFAAPGASSGTT